MTNSARIKARISSTKRQCGQTKDEQIRELRALVAAANNPDEVATASKEPLVGQQPSHPCTHTSQHLSSQETAALLTTSMGLLLPGLRLQLR